MDAGLESRWAVDEQRCCAGVRERMQGETDCSSSPLSVTSSRKLVIFRMRRREGLGFVPA